MAIGAYTMGDPGRQGSGCSFWLALPARDRWPRSPFGLLVGLPSLRLRADYFAIATIAFAEIVRSSPRTREA